MIKSKQILLKSLAHKVFYDRKSNLYNVFILKCGVSITNISIEHYIEEKTKKISRKLKANIL